MHISYDIVYVCACVTNIIIFSVRNKFDMIRTVIKVYEVLITTLRTNVRKENRTSKLKNIHTMCAFFLNTNKQENIKIINYYSRLYALLLLLTYHTSSYIKLFTFLLPYLV